MNDIRMKTPCLVFYIIAICISLVICLLPSGCTKDPVRETTIGQDTVKTSTYQNGIFIINEGNYNWGNASVTFLDDNENAIQDIFTRANNRSLGDVAESMAIVDSLGYLLINNSNRIEVVSLKDFVSVKTISGLNSPRYMQAIDTKKAYVTNLQNCISILDLQTNTLSGTIKTEGWTENLVLYGKLMVVASIGSFGEPSSTRKAQILFINTETDSIVGRVQTGKEPIGIAMDSKNMLWVLCSGGYDNYEAPTLMMINPASRVVEKEIGRAHV